MQAGSSGADAQRPAVSHVVACVNLCEPSMGRVVTVFEDALFFPPAALVVDRIKGRQVSSDDVLCCCSAFLSAVVVLPYLLKSTMSSFFPPLMRPRMVMSSAYLMMM